MGNFSLKIKAEDKVPVLNYVKKLLQEMFIGNSDQVSWPVSEQFDMMAEIIISKVYGQHAVHRKRLSRKYVLNAIVELKKKGKVDPEWSDFEQEINKMTTGYLASPKEDFQVLFPLYVNEAQLRNKRLIRMFELEFKKTSWKHVRSMKGWNQYLESLYIPQASGDSWKGNKLGRLFVPFVVHAKGRTYVEIFEEIGYCFDLFRALINFSYGFGRSRVIIAGAPEPMGLCLSPPVYIIFNADGNLEMIYYTAETYTYRGSEVTKQSIKMAERFLQSFQKISPEMKDIVTEAVLLYGQAMDTSDWKTAFLTLWQILESLTLQSASSLNMTDVARRIGFLIGNKNTQQLLNDFVGAMAIARNLLVHKGKFSEDGQDEVNLLKRIAERSILIFLEMSRKFTTRELLEEFYINCGLPPKRLHSRQKAIEAIAKFSRTV